MTEAQNYSVDDENAFFFTQTSVTRVECDETAKRLAGSDEVLHVATQGACSYTVYAGNKDAEGNMDKVVQFRLTSLKLNFEMIDLARSIWRFCAEGEL